MPTAAETRKRVVAGTMQGRAPVQKERPKPYTLTDVDTGMKKVSIFGASGSGKTRFLLGALLCGEKVLGLSTDLGGNGLTTITEELKRIGRTDLMNNFAGVDLSKYDDVQAFLKDPEQFWGGTLPFIPTVDFWDGFTTYQIDCLDEYVLSLQSSYATAGVMRQEGLVSLEQDWAAMKRGTMRSLRMFLAMTHGGVSPHKIITTLEDKDRVNKLTGKPEKGSLLQGASKDLINVGFDLVLQTFAEEKDGKISYKYRTVGDSSKFATKSRGIELPSVLDADPVLVWKKITGRE